MPTQEITIAKIAGVSGDAIATCVKHLVDGGEHAAYGVLDKLIAAIDEHRLRPPVVYYCKYIDYWSSGFLFQNAAVPPGIAISWDVADLVCFELSQAEQAAESLAAISRWSSAETRLYVRRVREALLFGGDLCNSGVVLIYRRVHGELIKDEQIVKASNELTPWLAEILQN